MKISILLLISFFSFKASAESYIYFQNNSSLQFEVNCSQTGTHVLESSEWWGMSGSITPWQLNTNVLWSNRNEGIHNGDDFYFAINLSVNGETVNLRIQLNGNFVGSDMSQSLEGPGFSHPWYNDNDFHEATFTLDGKLMTCKYTSYFTGGDDDVLFVIQEHDPFPILANDLVDENVMNVLSYNIFMLTPPIAYTNQEIRANYIFDHVHDYDVIVINEAFDNNSRDVLTTKLSIEYPYNTDVVDENGSLEDGGVIIYSRWPIEYYEDIVYVDCDDDDCLAAKGAMYAEIDKLGTPYHVFGTHTQAWPEAQNVITRQAQMAQLKTFVDSKNIPVEEAVIYGGDFNVEKIANFMNEYDDMFTILNSREPVYSGQSYTYDYEVSYFADDPYKEYLDYVMVENSHRIPLTETNNVIVLRDISDDMWDIFDLSDHLAVQGRFEFPDPSISISEIEESFDLSIYPNPAENEIKIKGLKNSSNYQIILQDSYGKVIDSQINQEQIDVSDFPTGIYFIKITSDSKSRTLKWIKN